MEDLLANAQKIVQQEGLRWTKQRQSLISLLAKEPDHYLNITDVDAKMRQRYPGISHNTIYRNLQEFKNLKLVEINQRPSGLVVKIECDLKHHHHFICQNCGKVQEIQMPDLDYDFYQQQLPGAKITGHSFELYGYCAECRRKLHI